MVASVVLTALIAYTLIHPLMLRSDANAVATPVPVKETPVMVVSEVISPEEVAEWDLFGESSAVEQAENKLPAPVVETRLMLSLKGVYAPDDMDDGWAIISADQGKDQSFMVGEQVTGGVTLAKIEPGKVLLERNGEMESLILEKERLSLIK